VCVFVYVEDKMASIYVCALFLSLSLSHTHTHVNAHMQTGIGVSVLVLLVTMGGTKRVAKVGILFFIPVVVGILGVWIGVFLADGEDGKGFYKLCVCVCVCVCLRNGSCWCVV
jgi:hypothetical protein